TRLLIPGWHQSVLCDGLKARISGHDGPVTPNTPFSPSTPHPVPDAPATPAAPGGVTLGEVLELLELAPLTDPGAELSRWRGGVQRSPSDRLFGGLLLAQALVAAGR